MAAYERVVVLISCKANDLIISQIFWDANILCESEVHWPALIDHSKDET